jgi:hypothetical protein
VNAYDQAVFAAVECLALAFIAIGVFRRLFSKYVYVQLYVSGLLMGDVARFLVMRAYGVRSSQYFVAYYLCDYVVVVLKYLAILSFFEIILEGSPFREIARRAFLGLFALLAVLSCGLVPNSSPNVLVEFQQNLHFAAVVLTAMLCVALTQLRIANPQLRMLVYGFGVSAAIQANGWALRNLISQDLMKEVNRHLSPLAMVLMLGTWCYSLLRIPSTDEAAQLVPELDLIPAMSRAEARG